MEEKQLTLTTTTKKKIDEIARSMNLESKGKTVVQLTSTDDPNKKMLELVSGNWKSKKPWFVVDDKGEVFALSSVESMLNFIHSLHAASNENFGLKLEKTIWKYFPVDFNDVWVVAMSELEAQMRQNKKSRVLEVDIDKLISSIHAKHPNLFYHIKEAIEEQNGEVLESY